jgi:hypothetical protein
MSQLPTLMNNRYHQFQKMNRICLLFLTASILLTSCQKQAYLFTSFREPATDGPHLAYSNDGYHL